MARTSVYSFGEDSPMKFEISDKLAKYYNEAAQEWFKAQQRFNQKFGRKWDPWKDPIEIKWNRKHKWAWNKFARIYKDVLLKDGPFHENDMMDDFLVKNTAEKAVKKASTGIGGTITGVVTMGAYSTDKKWSRVITVAVAGGMLYGFLRKR